MLDFEFDITTANIQIWLIWAVVFLMAYNYFTKESWKNLPPGPPNLPIIGSLPFFGMQKDIREPLIKMAAKYGDVFTVYLGSKRVVILNGHAAIKEAFAEQGNQFAGRPYIYFVDGIMEGYGIISSQGTLWREQRNHAISVLKDFGFGRTIIEERILGELECYINELKKNTGRPYRIDVLTQMSVANVIGAITWGKRLDYKDPDFVSHIDRINRAFDSFGNSGLLTTFPFVRYLPGDPFKTKVLKEDKEIMIRYLNRVIDEHKVALKNGCATDDFITVYLKRLEQEQNNNNSSFSEKQLKHIIIDLFGAGSETTSTTLVWAVLYMALNQDIQRRVQEEIDAVVGRTGVPKMKHRDQLPLTEACILESQRLGDVIPLGVPHATTEDVQFKKYFIPKGTMIMANMYSVHRDPKLWPEPDKFKPERFLNENGEIVKRQELIPFSIGKRLCMGANLAKMELFLYFASILQHFHIRLSPHHPQPNLKGKLTMSNKPHPECFVILTAR